MVTSLPSSYVSSTGRLTDAGLGALYGGGGGGLNGILDPGSLITQLTKNYLSGGGTSYNPYSYNPYAMGYYPMQAYGQQPDYYSILIATLQQDAMQRYGYQVPTYGYPQQQQYYGYPQQQYGYPQQQQYYGYPQQQQPQYTYQQPQQQQYYGYPQQQYGYPQQQQYYSYPQQQYAYQQPVAGYGYG